MIKIAVTGHRPHKLGGYAAQNNFRAIRHHMKNFLMSRGDIGLISGGALGIDQFWIEVGIYLGLPVTAALPFEGYNSRWPKASRDKYAELLDKCSDVRYICEPGYEAAKLQLRNEWMVDNCDELAAYWNGTPGGTCNCVTYANSIKRKVHVFDPDQIIANGTR